MRFITFYCLRGPPMPFLPAPYINTGIGIFEDMHAWVGVAGSIYIFPSGFRKRVSAWFSLPHVVEEGMSRAAQHFSRGMALTTEHTASMVQKSEYLGSAQNQVRLNLNGTKSILQAPYSTLPFLYVPVSWLDRFNTRARWRSGRAADFGLKVRTRFTQTSVHI
jgi:hypothetical protein